MTIFHTKGGANEQLFLGEALASLSKTMRWVLKYLVLSMFIKASNLWVGKFQTLNLAKVFCDRLPKKLSFNKRDCRHGSRLVSGARFLIGATIRVTGFWCIQVVNPWYRCHGQDLDV